MKRPTYSAREINALLSKWNYMYLVESTDSDAIRISKAKTVKGVMFVRSLNTGKWIEVQPLCIIEQRS